MSRTRVPALLAVAGTMVGTAPPALGQEAEPAPTLRVDAAEITIGGRVQTQFNTTTVDSEPGSTIVLRRVRLEAEVRVNDLVSGKVQPDFAGDRVVVKDAYLELTFSPAVKLLAGRAHRPFSLLEQTSSKRILPIERGVAIRGVEALDEYELVSGLAYSDRDVGVQVRGAPDGAPLGLAYAAGVFQGPLGQGVGGEATRQYAARATVEPLRGVRVGAAWSNRAFARETASGDTALERGDAFEVDLEVGDFQPGLHLLGEVAFGDADPIAETDFFGAQAWLGYRTGPISRAISTVEPVLRLSHGRVDDGPGRAGGTLITPGLNVYFGGLNRVMFNYDVWSPRGDGDVERSFKAMFQLAF